MQGGPLLGLLYKRYKYGEFTLVQTVHKLFRLKFEAIFTEREESYIYSIENDFDLAKYGIYGSIEIIQEELERFLSFYQEYSISNYDQRQDLDKIVELDLENDYKLQSKQNEQYKSNLITNHTKPWWKIW